MVHIHKIISGEIIHLGKKKFGCNIHKIPSGVTPPTAPIIADWDYDDGDDFYNLNSNIPSHSFNIQSNGGSPIISYGIVLSESPAPTLSDHFCEENSDDYIGIVELNYTPGDFEPVISLIDSLYKTYYVRPYVSNAIGTTYGRERIIICGGRSHITTKLNICATELIGTQLWTKFNWESTAYSGGSLDIKYPNNDINNTTQYGGLYKWSDANLLAPTGWHLPSIAECDTLSTYLGGNNVSGGKLKDTGDTYWNSGNTGATNSALFYSRGAGWVSTNGTTSNDFLATQYLWTTTLDSGVNYFRFKQSSNAITSDTAFSGDKDNYYSVRLIKD